MRGLFLLASTVLAALNPVCGQIRLNEEHQEAKAKYETARTDFQEGNFKEFVTFYESVAGSTFRPLPSYKMAHLQLSRAFQGQTG